MPAPQGKRVIPIASPIRGINRVVAREQQDEATCWDANNVLPFDAFGRRRVAQRFGTSKQYSTQLGDGTQAVQGMLPIETILYPNNLSGGIPTFTEKWSALTNWSNLGGGSWTPSTPIVTPPTSPTLSPHPQLHFHQSLTYPIAFSVTINLVSGMTTAPGPVSAAFCWNLVSISNAGFTGDLALLMAIAPNAVTPRIEADLLFSDGTSLALVSAGLGNGHSFTINIGFSTTQILSASYLIDGAGETDLGPLIPLPLALPATLGATPSFDIVQLSDGVHAFPGYTIE